VFVDFGRRMPGGSVLVGFGRRGREVERVVFGFGRGLCAWSWARGCLNDMRATASETAYGCTGGAKL
jgi:hypothetical protein